MKESVKEMRRQVIDWEKIFAKAIPDRRVTGRKARGLQMEEIGCKCQTFFFISPLNSRRTQTLHGNFFSYVMKLCIYFGICLPSKWLHLRLFFLFSNLGLRITQQTSIHINCFMAGGWHISCHPISKMHNLGEGPGETLPALRYISYLINNFQTDIKQFAKTSKEGHSPSPFWCSCQNISLSLFIL